MSCQLTMSSVSQTQQSVKPPTSVEQGETRLPRIYEHGPGPNQHAIIVYDSMKSMTVKLHISKSATTVHEVYLRNSQDGNISEYWSPYDFLDFTVRVEVDSGGRGRKHIETRHSHGKPTYSPSSRTNIFDY